MGCACERHRVRTANVGWSGNIDGGHTTLTVGLVASVQRATIDSATRVLIHILDVALRKTYSPAGAANATALMPTSAPKTLSRRILSMIDESWVVIKDITRWIWCIVEVLNAIEGLC